VLVSEIITWRDDHSRYALHVSAHVRITGPVVLTTFRQTTKEHGIPASTLTDNGMVYTTRLSGGKGGRNGLESELRRLHVLQKNSRPNHPTTCGKVERFQQTMKKWLRASGASGWPRDKRTVPRGAEFRRRSNRLPRGKEITEVVPLAANDPSCVLRTWGRSALLLHKIDSNASSAS
jgi:transposase InsO family protein